MDRGLSPAPDRGRLARNAPDEQEPNRNVSPAIPKSDWFARALIAVGTPAIPRATGSRYALIAGGTPAIPRSDATPE